MRRLSFLTAAFLIATPALAQEAGDKGEFCIDTVRIDSTSVIDDRTILVEMVGRDDYRKITLANRCPGLKIAGGFAYDTRIPQLCRSEIIRPVSTTLSASCAIDTIVKITPEEADALRKQR